MKKNTSPMVAAQQLRLRRYSQQPSVQTHLRRLRRRFFVRRYHRDRVA